MGADPGIKVCEVTRLGLCQQRWDDIEIEEETEEGTAMKSTIHVPMHVSQSQTDLFASDQSHFVNKQGYLIHTPADWLGGALLCVV